MSLNYDTLEAALRTWVTTASGLDNAHVLWAYRAYQGGQRPAGEPHITLMLGPSVPVGIDGVWDSTDLTRAAGQEIKLATIAIRAVTLTLQCFGGTPAGAGSAVALLTKVREKLALPSIRTALNVAGISPFAPGAVQTVPQVQGSKLEPRAVLEVRCYVDASESEYVGFIEHVRMTNRIVTPPQTFTVNAGA